MKAKDEVLLIPHEEGFRSWRWKGGQAVLGEGDGKDFRSADWIALPAKSVTSVPMRFQAADAARRESAAQLELEAAGFSNEIHESSNFEILHHGDSDSKDEPLSAVIQTANLPATILEAGNHARYAPSVAFRQLQPGEVLIWRESGSYVVAVPSKLGKALHFQALASKTLDADAATELRRIFAALELAGLDLDVQTLCLQAEVREDLSAFQEGIELPITIRPEPPPRVPDHVARLVPAPIVRLRHERQQQRMVILGVVGFAFIIVAALSAMALRLWMRERSISQEKVALEAIEPELQAIRETKANWLELEPAIQPLQYPVETIYQIILMLPSEGIRLTRFEIKLDNIILDGEASSVSHGIEFKDKLVASPAFKKWIWEFPNPTTLPDGRATFRAEARPVGQAEDSNVEGVDP